MKRILTFFLLASFALPLTGQTGLNNLGFENWTTNSLSEPQPKGFASLGASENTSDPIEGSSALKLEVYYNSFLDDTIAASVLGEFNGSSIEIGDPYTKCPDSITGFIRYDLLNQDTGAVRADAWTTSGDTVASAQMLLGGSQNSWTKFTLPFSPMDCNGKTADTIGVYMTAESVGLGQYVSDFQDRGTQTLGSVLELDGLYLHDSTNTSLMELKEDVQEISVRPNPAKEKVVFEFGSKAERIRIFDMTGRTVRTVEVAQASEQKQVLVSELDRGMYLYRVEDQNGRQLYSDKLQIVR